MRVFKLAAICLALITAGSAFAANHREAPITALDHKADITDVYAFVSYDAGQVSDEAPEKVTLIMSVDPLLEPANGPTVFPFDPFRSLILPLPFPIASNLVALSLSAMVCDSLRVYCANSQSSSSG